MMIGLSMQYGCEHEEGKAVSEISGSEAPPCAHCKAIQAEIEIARARIADLEARLDAARRLQAQLAEARRELTRLR